MKRYTSVGTSKTSTGKTYFKNAIYPYIPPTADDVYVIGTAGDRYDTLAQQFYKDSTLWWIIASANNSQRASLVVTPGIQLRIPANPTQAIQLFNELNS